MGYFAVIDTETNWIDQVMSIGCCIADTDTLQAESVRYYVIAPEYEIGGMYESTLFSDSRLPPVICSRREALKDMTAWLKKQGVAALFAYNASFDRNHLPELSAFQWYDIMRLAAYRQFNPCIPKDADCFSTGRMKRGYGVEAVLRMLSKDRFYHESHSALGDALDELEIIRLLGHPLSSYIPLNAPQGRK